MRRMRAMPPLIGAATVTIFVLTGCAGSAVPGSTAGTAMPDVLSADIAYECNGRAVDPAVYATAVRADELPESAVEAIESAVDDFGAGDLVEEPGSWIVGAQTDDLITLLRPRDRGIDGGSDHDLLTFEHVSSLPSTGASGWMLTSSTECELRIDPAPLTVGEVRLDPEQPLAAGQTEVGLLVTERACNSGRDAEGRIELISLEETAETVMIHVAVRPSVGEAHTCQSNPPTAFTVELAEPLGERTVLDGSLVFPRTIERFDPPVS